MTPEQLVEHVLARAECVGPVCRRRMEDPTSLALVLSRIRSGADPEDAMLAVLHGMLEQPGVGDEFMSYFLGDLMAVGRRVRAGALARLLETGDLVQSVLADVWPEIQSVEFRSRGQFMAYLAKRMRWKSGDVQRQHGSRRRVREVPAAEPPELWDDGPSPASALAREEERERLAVALVRLAPRDRDLLAGWLRGETVSEAAERLALTGEAASKARCRALERARDLL